MPTRGEATTATGRRGTSANGSRPRSRPSCSAEIAERLGEPSRARGEEPGVLHPTSGAHLREPVGGLERPQEHGRGDALVGAHDVRTPVDAVRAVDVEAPRRAEHRGIAARRAAVGVACGIVGCVRLGLDDHAPDAVDEKRPADEGARDSPDVPLEERRERAQKSGSASAGRAVAARSRRARRPRSLRSTRPSSAAEASRSARSSAPSRSTVSPAS